MTWETQLERIRRFLRDPDGNIWSDSLLLRLYNDEQFEIHHKCGQLQEVKVVRLPSQWVCSYVHDWEWTFSGHADGEVFMPLRIADGYDYTVCFEWEIEHLYGADTSATALGSQWTHPFEAYMDTPDVPPPALTPTGFSKMVFIAWDKKPIDPTTLAEIISDDPSWRSRTGDPQVYYRDGKIDDHIYLYPWPYGEVEWDPDNDVDEGDPSEANYATSGLDLADNLCMVFDKVPTELTATTDESDYIEPLQKYIEYGVLERAYGSNTDGKIESLRDYWGYRKKVGIEAVKAFGRLKRMDRQINLTSPDIPAKRTHRHPRLPDAYPAI